MIYLKNSCAGPVDNIQAIIQGLSHNMGAPVRGLQQFSQLLLQHSGPLEEKQHYWLALMEQNATDLQQMLADLVTLAKLNTPPDNKQPFDPVALTEQQIVALSQSSDNALQAKIELTGEVGKLYCHASLWQRLIHELLSNALLFQPQRKDHQPQVTIHWSLDEQQGLRLQVADNGLGVAEDNYRYLGTPFKRLQSQADYPGRGMGLCICQRIAQIQGGMLDFSPTEDSGLCVDYRVPVYNELC